jgi:dTMP kinase
MILGKKTDMIKTAEPTREGIGAFIRSSEGFIPEAEALLFVADRAQHTHMIRKWVKDGKIVICDRYYASTLAYQSASMDGRAVDMEWLKAMNDKVIMEPDITFLFDIDPETGMERVESRGSKSRFEALEYLKKVRSNYLKIAKERGFMIIDASMPKEKVAAEVLKRISDAI